MERSGKCSAEAVRLRPAVIRSPMSRGGVHTGRVGRTVSALVTWEDAYLGAIGPFAVGVPWWPEVEPVVAHLPQAAISAGSLHNVTLHKAHSLGPGRSSLIEAMLAGCKNTLRKDSGKCVKFGVSAAIV